MPFADLSASDTGRTGWRILLIDNEESSFILIRDLLLEAKNGKYALEWAPTDQAGIDALSTNAYDAVLMSDGTGAASRILELREAVSNRYTPPIILLSDLENSEADIEALQAGAADYLCKDELNAKLLERSIRYAIERARMESEADAALHKALERAEWLSQFPDENPYPIVRVAANGHILYCNRAAKKILGGQCDPGQTIREPLFSIVMRAAAEGRQVVQDVQMGERFFSFSVLPILPEPYLNLYGIDITDRTRAEEAMRASEEREHARAQELETLMDAVPAMIWISRDPECREMIGNRTGYEFLGMGAGQNISKTASEAALANQHYLNMKDGRPLTAAELPMQLAAATGKPARDFTFEIVFDDGAVYKLIGNVNPLFDSAGKPAGAIGAFVDITELRNLQTQQIEYRTQMEVHHRLIEQREKDRQAIARDIHDGPVQTLSSTLFNIQFALDAFSDPSLRVEIEQIGHNIKNAVQELRQVIYELRPPPVIRFGLAKAIQFHAEDLRDKNPELNLVLDLADDNGRLSESMVLTLYRIYQEAITNIIRHAQATQAWVRFHLDENEGFLEIRDNGKGLPFDENIVNLTESGHYGLAGITERVEAIGGTLTLSSVPGSGTTIRVTAAM